MEVIKKRDGSLKVLLKDEDIRPVLFEYLEERTPVVRFFEELVLGRSRADAVMISSSEETPSGYSITGFEIKSDKDQLKRLERQSRNYSHYCDFNYLVTGEKYAGSAAEEIPESWGIFLVRAEAKEGEESAPRFFVELIRPAKPTPRLRLSTQMKLLWRTELTNIIRAHKLGGVSGKNKMKLADLIIEKLGKDEAHCQMCMQLLDRDYTIFETAAAKEKEKKEKEKEKRPEVKERKKSKTTGTKESKATEAESKTLKQAGTKKKVSKAKTAKEKTPATETKKPEDAEPKKKTSKARSKDLEAKSKELESKVKELESKMKDIKIIISQ